MILSHNAQCITCKAAFRLRVGVGHEARSIFSFACHGCKQPVSFVLHVDQVRAIASIENDENCEHSDAEGLPINFHPGLLTPSNRVNDPTYSHITEVMRCTGKWTEWVRRRSPPRLIDMWLGLSYGMDFAAEYKLRRKALDLHSSGRDDIAKPLLDQVRLIDPRPDDDDPYVNAMLDLVRGILYPGYQHRLKEMNRFVDSIRDRQALDRARGYMKRGYHGHLIKFLASTDAFFECYGELAKVLSYVRCETPIDSGLTSASPGFPNISMVYGNAFETLMDFAVVPAILNNVANNRNYSKFATIDLDAYLTIDKAGRMKCFEQAGKLVHLCEGVDSQLRNGSHHGAISFNEGRSEVIYMSGRPPKERAMPYSVYLEKTCLVHFHIWAVFLLEHRIVR